MTVENNDIHSVVLYSCTYPTHLTSTSTVGRTEANTQHTVQWIIEQSEKYPERDLSVHYEYVSASWQIQLYFYLH